MYREWILTCSPAIFCLEKDSKSVCTLPKGRKSVAKTDPHGKLQDGERRRTHVQSSRAQGSGACSAKTAPVRQLAWSFRPPGAMEPPQSRKTGQRHGDRSGDAPKGKRPLQLRSLHVRLSNSQSQRHANATTRRSRPQRHMREDQSNSAQRIKIFPHDATRMTFLFVLKTKTAKGVRECFLEFRNVFEQDGQCVKSIRTDGGGEYRKQMAEFCRETGIHHKETALYTAEQKGVAEQANRTICE